MSNRDRTSCEEEGYLAAIVKRHCKIKQNKNETEFDTYINHS